MAKKKTKWQEPPQIAVRPASQSAGPSPLAAFLEKHSLVLAILVIALGTLRIVSTYSQMALTWDEPGHMACGLQYLAEHVYLYEAQHPPLARVASAIGPYLSGARPLHTRNQDQEGVNVMYRSGHPAAMMTWMRLGILPFFVLAAAVVYLWARRYFGGAAGVLSVAMFTLEPTLLAHAGLATTDMPMAACLTAAFFALLVWAEEPTWLHSILLGVATALAVVSKFTALGFFPVAAAFAALAWLLIARPGMDGAIAALKSRALPFLAAVATGALTIWAVYSFSLGKPHGWDFSVPAPSLFEGVESALQHNNQGHGAYLLGEVTRTGWWYFFPVVLMVKTPIAWLLLTAIGIGVSLTRRAKLAYWMPVAFAAGVLIPGMTSHVNIGLRHILPIFSGLAILAGLGLLKLIDDSPRKKWAGALAVVLSLWLLVSGALHHPFYLAYFNELAGDHPENIVVDSDLDWGQDTIRLARRLKELGATQVNYSTLNLGPQELAVWPGLPPVKGIDPIKPAEGWTAVSLTLLKVSEFGLNYRYPTIHPWVTYLQPRERLGGLLLYYVAPGSIPPDLR
jgi:4-amino-4-deoxy-L-arabinose transferase-like glycosyltransferase